MTYTTLPLRFRAVAIAAAVLAICTFAQAQAPTGPSPRKIADCNLPGTDAKVNLTSIEPMDIVQLIEILAHRGNLNNIVIGKGVTGMTAKLKFDDVTVADALDTILAVNQLAFELHGGILTILTDAEYQAMYGRSFLDQKVTKVVGLKFADPQRVAQMLAPVKSADGTVVSDQVTGAMILVDRPEKIQEMEAVIAASDIATISRVVPTETRTFKLQYGDTKGIQAEVESLLTKDLGKVRSDVRTKTLIVTDLTNILQKVGEMVALFDRRPRQVFIAAKIFEVKLTDTTSLGVNWESLFESLDPRATINTVSSPAGVDNPALKMNVKTITSGGEFSAVVEALKTIGETKVLSNPQITVMDGEEARIEVVQDQPYKEVQLESGTTNITGTTYLFKKVGVQLAVTPRINDEDIISVLVRPEVSTISEWYDGDVQQGTPVVRQAVAETKVMVRDMTTIIIGGLIQDRSDTTIRSIPILGQIPLLGALFRQKTDSISKAEIVVFLTPRIVTGDEQYLRLQEEKKQLKE
jgi:type II secretory pathway component GspD/PulD (secretin)